MKTIAYDIKLQYNQFKKPELVLLVKSNVQQEVKDFQELIIKGKTLNIEIKKHSNRRSLDSNAYLWVILNEMAVILNTTKDELYLIMLDRYGTFCHIVVKPSVVDKVKQEWRTVRVLGEVTINGQIGIQMQCFFGSSTYDTKSMCTLLNGVVEEAKEMGIDTMSTKELSLLNERWGK